MSGEPWSPDPDLNPIMQERRALKRISELNQGISELRFALEMYGVHELNCAHRSNNRFCNCGLRDILKKSF